MGGELDVMPALTALEKAERQIALPAIHGETLLFRRYLTGQPLHTGPLNTQEPSPGNAICIPSVVLVPLLAFDRSLMRLGQGAGFYDRALADLRKITPVLSIGIAFECQMTDRIPAEPHDQHLDLVITDHNQYGAYPKR